MSTHHVVILGMGSAGLAAARTLASQEQVTVTLVGHTNERPFTRMLIKGVAFGDTDPEAIRARLPRVEVVTDSVVSVDVPQRLVVLESGAQLGFDSLIIATGSRARELEEGVPGVVEAAAAGVVTSLHSVEDAVHIASRLQHTFERVPVAIYGAGLTASETASSLRALGHPVALIARSELPGVGSFGGAIAGQIAAAHSANVDTYFGRTITAIRHDTDSVVLTLDDGVEISAALVISALGTIPSAPAPWRGGVTVDGTLAVVGDPESDIRNVYAAGGVAIHRDALASDWRIDHWDDAAEQGAHAARGVLFGLGLGADPGVYLPRSAHLAMIYGHAVAAAGYTGTPDARADDTGVYLHELGGVVVGASGLDAVGPVYQWAQLLHGAGN
ncbi:MAG: FAD-dependent oxidoreductase [Leucobacter sp.]|nr:FAD-dependent oxidoreductase [Leucobacter sp.]